MYAKLALRNICRSLRDYIIFFVTIALVAALVYSFLALGFSPDIIRMTENMSILTSAILILSVLIAFMASFIIRYAIRFMLGQRRKEFAIYELLGMEVRVVCNLFLIENMIIGSVAFLFGSFVGMGLSGILNQVVKVIFDVPHSYQISFSIQAWLVTLLLFTLMYVFAMLQSAKVIRQRKIVDLLYDSQKNEECHFKAIHQSVLIILLSFFTAIAGIILLTIGLRSQTNVGWFYLTGACLLIIISIYGLQRMVPFLLYHFAKRNPNRKYKGENLFFLGQIGRRISSAGRTMAVVAILLTISLATMFAGLTSGASYKANMEAYYPYDAGISINAPFTLASMEPVISFTDEHCKVEDSLTYYLYTVPGASIEALSLSDYNHLRQMLGFSPISIGEDEFLVHCDTWSYLDRIESALNKQPEITLNQQKLTAMQTPIMTEPMEQYLMAGTNGYVLVLPDKTTQRLSGDYIRLAMRLENNGYPELKNELRKFLNSENWTPEIQPGREFPERIMLNVSVKAWGVANSLTGFTVLSFCGLYLSIIFIILSCAVLAFEQLSAIDKNRKNYKVLAQLGVSNEKQIALARKELSTVFFIPLLFPIVFIVLLIIGIHLFYGKEILQQGLVLIYGIATILIFGVIYLIYFIATLFLFKRVIL